MLSRLFKYWAIGFCVATGAIYLIATALNNVLPMGKPGIPPLSEFFTDGWWVTPLLISFIVALVLSIKDSRVKL